MQSKPPLSYPTLAPSGPVASAVTSSPNASGRKLLSVIADASGVPQRSANAHAATNHLTFILGDPLLKRYNPPVKIKVNAVASRSANPATVRSTWRSETNTATGRHGTRLAGISAIDREAIATESAMTMKMGARPPDAGDFGWSTLLEPIAAPEACGVVVIVGTTGGLVATTFFRWTFFFGFTCLRTGFLTTGFCACTTLG